MISEELLSKWEKQCASACEGPWLVSNIKDKNYYPDGVLSLRGKDDVEICGPIAKEDARFMATAREAMPLLIARVRELEVALEVQKDDRAHYAECWYIENQANQRRQKVISQLEREATWMAHKLACYYQAIDRRCNDGQMTDYRTDYEYWRNEARKAVENAD